MLLVESSLDEDLVLDTNQHKRSNLKKLSLVEQEVESILVRQMEAIALVEIEWAELVVQIEIVEPVAYIEIDAPIEQLVWVEMAERVKLAERKK